MSNAQAIKNATTRAVLDQIVEDMAEHQSDLAAAITALAEIVRDLIPDEQPERAPVPFLDYLPEDVAEAAALEAAQAQECPSCGPACICDIKAAEAAEAEQAGGHNPPQGQRRSLMYAVPPDMAEPVMHADVPAYQWGELP